MSKNFELLSQLGEQHRLFEPGPAVTAPSILARPHPTGLSGTASEEEVKLVQRVFLLPGRDAPRVVVFCGVDQRDGASPICARASEILATRQAGSVCLMDADLHSPSLHKRYGMEDRLGVTDALLEPGGVKNFAHQIGDGGLWLLPAGSRAGEKGMIVSLDGLRTRITELRVQFDYVLISAPPVNLYSDAILYGQLADGVILVLKANSTRRETAMKVKESLEASNVRLLGAILGERTFPIPEALYRRL